MKLVSAASVGLLWKGSEGLNVHTPPLPDQQYSAPSSQVVVKPQEESVVTSSLKESPKETPLNLGISTFIKDQHMQVHLNKQGTKAAFSKNIRSNWVGVTGSLFFLGASHALAIQTSDQEHDVNHEKIRNLDTLSTEEILETEAKDAVSEAIESKSVKNTTKVEPPWSKDLTQGVAQATDFFENIFDEIFQDTCESNFDCMYPEVCCDLIFKKMCCSSGSMVQSYSMQPIRIPVTKDDGYMNGY